MDLLRLFGRVAVTANSIHGSYHVGIYIKLLKCIPNPTELEQKAYKGIIASIWYAVVTVLAFAGIIMWGIFDLAFADVSGRGETAGLVKIGISLVVLVGGLVMAGLRSVPFRKWRRQDAERIKVLMEQLPQMQDNRDVRRAMVKWILLLTLAVTVLTIIAVILIMGAMLEM